MATENPKPRIEPYLTMDEVEEAELVEEDV